MGSWAHTGDGEWGHWGRSCVSPEPVTVPHPTSFSGSLNLGCGWRTLPGISASPLVRGRRGGNGGPLWVEGE